MAGEGEPNPRGEETVDAAPAASANVVPDSVNTGEEKPGNGVETASNLLEI